MAAGGATVIENALAAPAEDAWPYLRDPALIRRWFGWNAPGLDEEVELIFREGEARDEQETGDYDAIAEGWRTFLAQLRFALARHPKGEERRTFYRSSPASRADALPVARPLGLETAARAAPGTRFEVELGPGDAVGGEVWMRSEHQLP